MNILLTGSNGFVGSYFQNNYSKKYNISTFSFLNDDINTLYLYNTDTIIHLSALVHQMGGANKQEYEKVNVTQTLELAQKAKETGVGHFIFMSTVKVYGEETEIKYTENTTCLPQDEYGKSKLKAELMLQKLENNNFTVSIIRTPIIYGYGVKANIKNLISLVSKVPILPFGNINNKRSMVYIGNICHLIDILCEKQVRGIFLASDDIALSTTELIESIGMSLSKKIYLIEVPFFKELLKLLKPNFYKRLYSSLEVDNNITKEQLSFKNIYSIKDGIYNMINGEH